MFNKQQLKNFVTYLKTRFLIICLKARCKKFNKQNKQQFKQFCLLQCAVMLRYCKRFNVTQMFFAQQQAKHFCVKHSL
jgi:hypothetical protein